MDRWIGKVVVVTGASAGIGLAIVKALVREGMTVVGLARRKEKMEVKKFVLRTQGIIRLTTQNHKKFPVSEIFPCPLNFLIQMLKTKKFIIRSI